MKLYFGIVACARVFALLCNPLEGLLPFRVIRAFYRFLIPYSPLVFTPWRVFTGEYLLNTLEVQALL